MRIVFNLGKALILLLVVWLVALIYLSGPLLRNNEADVWAKRLLESQEEVAGLKRERDGLSRRLRDLQSQNDGGGEGVALVKPEPVDVGAIVDNDRLDGSPNKEYELTRRKASRDVREMWNFARAQLDDIAKH